MTEFSFLVEPLLIFDKIDAALVDKRDFPYQPHTFERFCILFLHVSPSQFIYFFFTFVTNSEA